MPPGEKSLDVKGNRDARAIQAFFGRLALRDDPGQGWYGDRVAAFLVIGIKQDRVPPFVHHRRHGLQQPSQIAAVSWELAGGKEVAIASSQRAWIEGDTPGASDVCCFA